MIQNNLQQIQILNRINLNNNFATQSKIHINNSSQKQDLESKDQSQ